MQMHTVLPRLAIVGIALALGACSGSPGSVAPGVRAPVSSLPGTNSTAGTSSLNSTAGTNAVPLGPVVLPPGAHSKDVETALSRKPWLAASLSKTNIPSSCTLVNTSFGYFTVRYVGAPPPGTSADDPGCDIGVYIGPNANNSIISNVTMIDFEAGIWVDGATNVQISGSTLAENYVGLYVANSHGGGSVNVTRTTFFDNGGGAYLFRNAMSTFGFGNTFTDNGVGVDSWEADTNVKLGTFLNNWYAGTFYYDSTGGVTNSSSTGANCGFAFAIAGSTPYINFFANTAAFNWYGFWFYQVPGFDMWLNLQNSFDIGFGNTHNSYFGQSGFPYDCEYFEENPPITNRDTSIPAPRTK